MMIAFTGSDDSGNLDIYLTDVRGNTSQRLTEDAASDSHPAWFPEGMRIAFTSDREGERPSGRLAAWAVRLLSSSPNAQEASISPDGNRIAFCRESAVGDFRIWVVSLYVSSSAQPLTGDNDGIWSHHDPAWSPDGKTICYGTGMDFG